MTESAISVQQRALLEEHLCSFEKLELLHMLRVAGQPVSRTELAAASRLDVDLVEDVLADLERARLIELDKSRKLASLGGAARESVCESLMALYQADRIAVLSILSSIAVSRIREMAAHAFADAFVLRHKKKKDDG